MELTRIQKMISSLGRPVKDRTFIEQEVFRFTKGQAIRDMFIEALPHYETGDYEKIDPLITQVLNVQMAAQGGMGHFFVRDVKDRTKKRKEPVVPGIPTGLKLDNHLKHGGMIPGRIYCVLAPPNSGKTMTMAFMGGSAVVESVREERILHIDLEQGEYDIADLYDAFFSRIQINSLSTKPNTVQKLVKDLGRKYGEFLVIKSFPRGTLSISQLRAYIRQLQRQAFYPTVLSVDYPALMLDEEAGKNDDEYTRLARIIMRLGALGHEIRAAVLAGLQGTRDSLGAEIIDINKIQDSFKAAAHADVIMAICQTVEEARRGRARYFLAKNKFGPNKVEMKARVDWARCLIRNL
jgi:replicative DNA helicase